MGERGIPARGRTKPPRSIDDFSTEPVPGEREAMLGLAVELQRWPARNPVFRTALDRAAQDVLRMAVRQESI